VREINCFVSCLRSDTVCFDCKVVPCEDPRTLRLHPFPTSITAVTIIRILVWAGGEGFTVGMCGDLGPDLYGSASLTFQTNTVKHTKPIVLASHNITQVTIGSLVSRAINTVFKGPNPGIFPEDLQVRPRKCGTLTVTIDPVLPTVLYLIRPSTLVPRKNYSQEPAKHITGVPISTNNARVFE
jgi:hypothetical protein